MSIHAVILCGGRGERFWPKSRRNRPKQFIPLYGSRTLIQETSRRIAPLCPVKRQLFVTPVELVPLLRRQVKVPRRNILGEPCGRNTAPAIGLAALTLVRRDPEAVMVVLPADHLITKRPEFLKAVRLAAQLAQENLLVTFGIVPSRPDTNYGYVHYGARIAGSRRLTAHSVVGFREKPDSATAQRYLAEGTYLWNSGMFVWRAATILKALHQFLPEFYLALMRFGKAIGTEREQRALAQLYRRAPVISIDYAVMEKAENIAVVRATFDWDDVGSWLALARHRPMDAAGNVTTGCWFGRETRNCIIDADSGIVATLGVSDLVIVRAGAAVLVAHKTALDGIKRLLEDIASHKAARRLL